MVFPVELVVSSAVCLVVLFLLRRAVRQSRAVHALEPGDFTREQAPQVAIIVPARNEATNIGPCLAGLVNQAYPSSRLSLLAVDDNSNDGTSEILGALAAQRTNLRALRSGPLTRGWTGKSQACWTGAQCAPPDAEWLCFVDADTRASPGLIVAAVAAARKSDLALLSLAPRQLLSSFAERLMIPCGLYLLSFSRDFSRPESPDGKEVSATGQFMLVRRTAYDAVGGHAAVSGAICEDLELARLLKRAGYRIELLDGARFIRARMYDGWRTLWPGFAKNLLETFGGAAASASIGAAAVALSWTVALLPIIDYAHCTAGSPLAWAAFSLAALAALAAFAFHLAGAVYLGIPFWYGFLFPIGYTLGAAIVLDALRRRATGRVSWKGRVYHG